MAWMRVLFLRKLCNAFGPLLTDISMYCSLVLSILNTRSQALLKIFSNWKWRRNSSGSEHAEIKACEARFLPFPWPRAPRLLPKCSGRDWVWPECAGRYDPRASRALHVRRIYAPQLREESVLSAYIDSTHYRQIHPVLVKLLMFLNISIPWRCVALVFSDRIIFFWSLFGSSYFEKRIKPG